MGTGTGKIMEKNPLGVRKGSWTQEEDVLLRKCIENYGEGKWHLVPMRAGLNRCRKSCRLRWLNYLRPNIKRGFFSKDEVDLIRRLHKLLGNRWSLIAGRLPGRTANDVKNFWNTHIDKKLGGSSGGTAAAASPRNSRERDKEQQQIKTITGSNILRPQPRTFSKPLLQVHHNVVPHESPRPNASCKTNEKPNNHKNNNNNQQRQHQQCSPTRPPLSSSSSSLSSLQLQQEDVDECIKWWSNLLDAAELGELEGLTTPPPFFDDNQQLQDHHLMERLLSHEHEGGHSDTPENGTGSWMKTSSMHLDVDGWGVLNSIHDQPFMPFN